LMPAGVVDAETSVHTHGDLNLHKTA
jgi:hypothetical protein